MIHAGWKSSPFIDKIEAKDLVENSGSCKHPNIRVFTYPYPVKEQADAGWLVHVCINCSKSWVD